MDNLTELPSEESPYNECGWFSYVFVLWIYPLFWKGYWKDIQISDLYKCPNRVASARLGAILNKQWKRELEESEKTGKQPSLLRALVRAFGWGIVSTWPVQLVGECGLRVLTPIYLGWLMDETSRHAIEGGRASAIAWDAFAIIAFTGIYRMIINPSWYEMQSYGMILRVSLSKLLYNKSLRLSRRALGQTTVGQMVNLLSNDVNRFDFMLIFFPFFVIGPILTVVVTGVVWMYIGPSVLAGVAIVVVYIPMQIYMGKLFNRLRLATAAKTDERIRLMNEIIPAMRVIKMYVWEKPFAKLVDVARRAEVAVIWKRCFLWSILMTLFNVANKLIVFVALVVYLCIPGNEPLTPQAVFVTMSLMMFLQEKMTLFFPYAISGRAEMMGCITRIERFLLLDELKKSDNYIKEEIDPESRDEKREDRRGVFVQKLRARWTHDDLGNGLLANKAKKGAKSNRLELQPVDPSMDVLQDVNISVQPGELVAVVGPVGSGKSSILMTIMGELPIVQGQVKVVGRIAYASQEPWTFAGTIRENILFGQPFDPIKYKKVLFVCALERDMTLFPDGDQTVVGERGVSLSGGQKARISLARALYWDADIFLLDDPLSAVDASVAQHIFQKAIRDYLKDKSVILVTHQVQFIQAATNILYLKRGQPPAYGTFLQLAAHGIDVAQFSAIEEEKKKEVEKKTTATRKDSESGGRVRSYSISSMSSVCSEHSAVTSLQTGDQVSMPPPEEFPPLKRLPSKMITNGIKKVDPEPDVAPASVTRMKLEASTTGNISAKVIINYLTCGTSWLILAYLLVVNVLGQVFGNAADYYLKLYTDVESANQTELDILYGNDTSLVRVNILETINRDWKIGIYGIVMALFIVFTWLRTISMFNMSMRSSIKLHDQMFNSVIRCPVQWFDSNPIGILLNRCSRDMGIVDDLLPPTLFDVLNTFLLVFGILIQNAYLDPWTCVPVVALSVAAYFIRSIFIRTMRNIKRYEGVLRSPVFSHLSSSLYGLTTIRAFGVQKTFEERFDFHQDNHSSPWHLFISASRWVCIILDWITCSYVAGTTIAMTANMNDSSMASSIGLAISSAITLSGSFQWGIRQTVELETQFTSVERVTEYTNLPEEGEYESPPERKPAESWPQSGSLVFDDMSLSYKPDGTDPVLKHLSLSIQPHEKIGIVGRTGAGKSSMLSALFRMTEPQGKIFIDGINTKNIGLHELRCKLSIIPQDPILFTGPVRRNLDPFDQFTDDKLWEVLHETQLADVVKELPHGLDSLISEGGGNFSVGQRQLICLARAILRQNKILVLDEATANVDHETDEFIQQQIRTKFADCTVLTIAHRLNTIMDSDRVLVMDAGRVVEFDTPYNLLCDQKSLFSGMVASTGKEMAEKLKEIAKNKNLSDKRNSLSPTHEAKID